MEYSGMVICLTKGKVVVITRDFQCYYVKRSPTIYVGKEIEFTERDILKNRSVIPKSGLTAACIVILFAVAAYILNFTGIVNKENTDMKPKVFAYINIDINPSLEIAIDDKGRVISSVPLNEDAKYLFEKSKIRTINISQSMNIMIDELRKYKFISEFDKEYILISSTLKNTKGESDKEYQSEKEKLDSLIRSLKYNLQEEQNGKVNVFLIQASLDERKVAQSKGISSGRYVLYNINKNLGNSFSIEDAKRVQIYELLKAVLANKSGNNSNMDKKGQNTSNKTIVPSSLPSITPSPLKPADATKIISITPDNGYMLKNTPTKYVNVKVNTPSSALVSRVPDSPMVNIESYNHLGYFIQQRFLKGLILKDTIMKEDIIYKMVPGLADPNCVSFESVNFPGHYLMHDNYIIYFKKPDGSANFNECATFRKVPGLADENAISLQSFNYPNRYIRQFMFSLQLDEIRTDAEKEDATFNLKNVN
jgi:hypothetical protein